MPTSLNTEMKDYGFRLTFPQTRISTGGDDMFAGDINLLPGFPPSWRFIAPCDTGGFAASGPVRRSREAAEFDALAHWAEYSPTDYPYA